MNYCAGALPSSDTPNFLAVRQSNSCSVSLYAEQVYSDSFLDSEVTEEILVAV